VYSFGKKMKDTGKGNAVPFSDVKNSFFVSQEEIMY
jgi:hypothetical protein